MSFNNIKINSNVKPGGSGNITLGSNDLSDVSISSLANGNYLKYNGTNWVNSSTTATSNTLNLIFIGQGASSQQYPLAWAEDDDVYFYSTSVVNTISGASVSSSGSHSNWYDQVSLPAGDYLLQASVHGSYSSSSGKIEFRFREGSNLRGGKGINLRGDNTSGTNYPGDAISYVSLSSTTTIALKAVEVSNASQGNEQAERGYLLIMKVA